MNLSCLQNWLQAIEGSWDKFDIAYIAPATARQGATLKFYPKLSLLFASGYFSLS